MIKLVRGDIINQLINKILLILSQNHKVFYLEKRNYKDFRCFKSYSIKIDSNKTIEFDSKTQLLNYLKEMI